MLKKHSTFSYTHLLFMLLFVFVLNVQCYGQSAAADAMVKTGRDYFNLFQYDKAFENFKIAINKDPDNWEAHYYAGLSLLKLKRNDEAERYLSKARNLNPTDLDTQKALGSIYMNLAKTAQNNGQNAKKIEYQLKACHAYPAATKQWQSLFDTWFANEDYDNIIKESDYLYKNTRELLDQGEDKSLQQALLIAAKAYYAKNDLVKAETFLNHANKIRQQNEELYSLKRQLKTIEENKVNKVLEEAENEINKKNYDKAITILKDASKLAGSRSSEIEAKIEELEKQININKYLTKLNELIKAEDYEKAAPIAEEASQMFPDNEEITSKATLITTKLEEIQEKIEEEEKNKKLQEELAKNKNLKIESYKRNAAKFESEKKYEEALDEIKKAMALRKDPELAQKIKSLQETIKKETERKNYYSRSYAEIQELYKAKNYESCIQKAEKLLNDYPENAVELAIVLTESNIELERFDKAGISSKPLEKEDFHKDLYNYAQGLSNYHAGKTDEAKKLLKEVEKGNSKYKKKASDLLWVMFLKRAQIGIYLAIITIILLIAPKVKDYLKSSGKARMERTLERIKETGNYEANYNFLKQRYDKDDVDNRKLVMLLYAAALQKKGENDLAYQIINEYLKKDNRSPLAKNIAGETAMAIGETSSIALEQIQGLLKLNENRKDVVEYLAKAYMQTKADHKLAQEFIAKYISLYPNDNQAITYLADVYMSRLIYSEQSAKTFEKAIKANPDKVEYYNALMENYKSIGNLEAANNVLQMINEKFPDYSSAPAASQQAFDPYSYPPDYAQQMSNHSQQPNNDNSQQNPNNYQNNMQMAYSNEANSQPDYDQQIQQQQQMFYQQQASNNQNVGNQQDYSQQIQQQQQMFYQQQASANQKAGMFPDYDSIGQEELPNMDTFGNLQPNQNYTPQPKAGNQIQGPKKNCPHCGAVNPAGEYYCNTCGKPF